MSAGTLKQYLSTGDGLARLAAHAQRLCQLQKLFEAALPEALRPHARIANFRTGKVYINAANGAIAAKIRQIEPRIANDLAIEGLKITQIVVKVQAWSGAPYVEPSVRPHLPGTQQEQALTALTHSLPADSKLKAALHHLLGAIKE